MRPSAASSYARVSESQGRLARFRWAGASFGRSLACEAFAFALEVRLVACDDLRPGGAAGGFVGAGEVDVDALFDRGDA